MRGDKVEYRYGGYVLIGTVVEYRQIGSYGRYFIDGFLVACEDGTFQGVACDACFAAHLDEVNAVARIFEASGLADGAHCSRCGADPVGDNHIQTEEV